MDSNRSGERRGEFRVLRIEPASTPLPPGLVTVPYRRRRSTFVDVIVLVDTSRAKTPGGPLYSSSEWRRYTLRVGGGAAGGPGPDTSRNAALPGFVVVARPRSTARVTPCFNPFKGVALIALVVLLPVAFVFDVVTFPIQFLREPKCGALGYGKDGPLHGCRR